MDKNIISKLIDTAYRNIRQIFEDARKTAYSAIRKFNLDEYIAGNWSTRQLVRQINSFYYERILASKNKRRARTEIQKIEPSATPHGVIKDPNVLEFLGLKGNKDYLEKELEQGLIDKLQEHLCLEIQTLFAYWKGDGKNCLPVQCRPDHEWVLPRCPPARMPTGSG